MREELGPPRVFVKARRVRNLALASTLALFFVVVGCGGASSAPPAASPPPTPPAALAAGVPAPPGHVRRADVLAAIDKGLGALLAKVELEPVVAAGKFRGFKIASLAFEGGLDADLKPGDVVTRVNDRPIERPEQADVAFRSLALARDLRIGYERDGQARVVRFEIDDEPGSALPPAGGAAPAPAAPAKK